MFTVPKNRLPNRQCVVCGFTLIEVMIIVVIIAILAALIVPRILKRPEEARLVAAHQTILSIQSALDLYKSDNGFYPTTEQGLDALVQKPSSSPIPHNWAARGYLHTVPVDPWGNPYHYRFPGKHGTVDVWSSGPPADVSGKSHDIGTWNMAR